MSRHHDTYYSVRHGLVQHLLTGAQRLAFGPSVSLLPLVIRLPGDWCSSPCEASSDEHENLCGGAC